MASKREQTPISLQVNCGFARVAILELSHIQKFKKISEIDHTTRTAKFLDMFPENIGSGKTTEYWYGSGGISTFDRHCNYILDAFAKKWHPTEHLRLYIETFSVKNWNILPFGTRLRHSISSCISCARNYYDLQKIFPGLPIFSCPPIANIPNDSNEKEVTGTILQELNNSYKSIFNHSFTSSAVKL